MLTDLRRRISALLLILLAAVVAVPFVAAAPAAAIGESTFTNPIEPDTADPTIEFYDGNYYMVATTWDNRVVMRKAPTLSTLGTTTPITVYTDTNPGRNTAMWAPELQRLNGPNGYRWYLMYTMGGTNGSGAQRLNVIESAGDDPMGPYTYKGHPLPTTEFSIDGSYMELNGELFVTWSQFAPAPDGRQSNWIARMTNPWTATGPFNILSQPTEAWETIGMPVNEGPVPLQKDGKTWIVYSASYCTTADYQLATLEYTGGDPVVAANWTKSDGPVFSKANGVFGSGHNDFFDSPDGTETWNLYHANARADGGCARERSARAQIVNWTADGEPDFGVPQSTTTPLRVPSGENAPITARVEGASWQLISRTTGLCATVSPTQSGDGAGLVQGSCATPRANWKLDTTGDGYLRVVNASSGKSLAPAACATSDATPVQQTSFLTTGCQQWSVAPTTEGWSSLTNRTSGKALDIAGGTAGAVIRQASATGAAGQDWTLRPSGPVSVASVASGKVFDLPACSTADGAVLQQQEWLDSPCQRATFTGASNGSTEIHPVSASAKCLAVTGGSTADNATVTQGPCGVTGSSWRVRPNNDGTVEFRAAHSGKALDLSFCSATNGARIGQYSVLNNDCQRFRLSQAAADTVKPLQLQSSVANRCVAGKVVLTASVVNTDDLPADVTVSSSFGTKIFPAVPAGKSATVAFTTRQGTAAAGSVSVSGVGSDDATRVLTANPAYTSASC